MSVELKETIDKLGATWHEYKTQNDAALAKGNTDLGEVKANLKKMSDEMDTLGKQLDEQAKKLANPDFGPQSDDQKKLIKHLKDFNDSRQIVSQGKSIVAATAEDLAKYTKAFEVFMRTGDRSLDSEAHKTMMSGSDPAGGYLVTPDTTGRLVQKIFETSDMRSVASIQEISTDALEGMKDLGEVGYGWVGETETRPATTTSDLGIWRIPVFEMYAMPEATMRLLDDARIDVGAWLANKVQEKFTRVENAAFVTGNGVGKPQGFLAYTNVTTADATRTWGQLQYLFTGTSAGFGTAPAGSDKLIDVVHTLKSAFRANANWAMSRATLGETRKLKDAEGNYLWLPSMTASQPSTLLGYPVKEFEDMPAIAANSLSIAFGDFRAGYQIVDRAGIRVVRDELTNKPFVRFYTVKRVGGGVVNFDAIKLLKFGTS